MSTGTDNFKLARIKLKKIELQLFRGDLDEKQKKENVAFVPFFRRFLNHIVDNYVRAKMEQARLLT
jgi:hypothetical protein